MPEGIIVLTQGHNLTVLGGWLLIIGLVVGIVLFGLIFAAWEDMELWHKIVIPIASVIFIAMAIIGANMNEEIMKVAVLNNSSLPALVENYEVIKTDGLIFTVKERKK